MENFPKKILLQVEKPARYIGNEVNICEKDLNEIDIRFAFAFPDVYEIGMSHLGLSILYFLINERKDSYCERVFAPWHDMENIMRKEEIPLFTLETGTAVNNFDFVGFTLQYEMSYSNIINMLNLSNIPIFSAERTDNDPLVCAGGPCSYNPEPLAEIIDFFCIGEAEELINGILDMYKIHKNSAKPKREFLEKLLDIEGVYVPKFYDVEYNPDGTIGEVKKNNPKAKDKIKKVLIKDLDKVFFPQKQLVPLIETVHDRVTLEIFRGCMRGCRFCQAGYIYRPVREKLSGTLIEQATNLVKNTGHEEISLVSLSTSDYRDFETLTTGLIEKFKDDKVNLSLPSLRIDKFSLDIMEKVQEVRKSSLTFAPEAGSQRMRNVINKGLTEEEILNGAKLAFEGGWNRVKLYFMIGLPTETEEDLQGIVTLSESIVEKYYENGKKSRPVSIVSSASCFVPKPFTPFQWEKQDSLESFKEKSYRVKKSFTRKQVKFNYHDPKLSIMEGVISRGDRRVAKVIVKAWELGARFDGWSEFFKFDLWTEAFEACNIDMKFYNERSRDFSETLPWDIIDIGISKDYFIKELEKSKAEVTTENCREKCSNCGATIFEGGVCFEK